jgi:hypothetical protein
MTNILFSIIAIVEIYYWVYWIPKNWRSNNECVNLVDAINALLKGD